MKQEDLDALSEIFTVAFNEPYGENWTKQTSFAHLHGDYFNSHPELAFVGVDENGKVRAGALAGVIPGPRGAKLHEGEFFVDPTYQGKGYGTQLFNAIKAAALANGYDTTWRLSTLSKDKFQHAARWWELKGFPKSDDESLFGGEVVDSLAKLNLSKADFSQIRPVAESDFPALTEIYIKTHPDQGWTQESAGERVRYLFTSPERSGLSHVAVKDGAVIGGISARVQTWDTGPAMAGGEVFVDPAHQKKGVGTQLGAALMNTAALRNILTFETEVPNNRDVEAWVTKRGLEKDEHLQLIVGDLNAGVSLNLPEIAMASAPSS